MPDNLDNIRREIEADRRRYNEMRKRHIAARKRSRRHARLGKRQSILAQNVGGHQESLVILSGALIASLHSHPSLRKHVSAARKHPTTILPRWVRHPTDRAFAREYARSIGWTQHVPPRVTNLGGFYDRGTKTIHLRPNSKIGHFLHEVIHSLSNPVFAGAFGDELNEGVAQCFADLVLRMNGARAFANHKYQSQVACARNLIHVMGLDKVASAYFRKRAVVPVMRELARKMRLSDQEFALERARDGLCSALGRLAARLPVDPRMPFLA